MSIIEQAVPAQITDVKEDKVKKYIDLACMYVDYNYMNNISVESIAQTVGLERTYFSKIFKKYVGMTPQQYIITYRVEKAKQLLASKDLLIKEVCASVGMPDQYHFSKVLKKMVKVSPIKFCKSKEMPLP